MLLQPSARCSKLYDRAENAKTFIKQSAAIGADVPVCLQNNAAWMCGLGERVTSVSGLTPLPALLVNPRIKLSTAAVFKTLNAKPLQPEQAGLPPSLPVEKPGRSRRLAL